jgi:L,D-peptidoglycan transpeptidase YkuD (ErfK/YbiS/YcfS/YnhG family)
MPYTIKTVLFHSFLLLFSFNTYGQNMDDQVQVAIQIVNANNHLLINCRQLLVVYNEKPEDHQALLVVMEKTGKDWKKKLEPMLAGVGRNGFAEPNKKIEGDGKTPTGLFRLGQLFAYENDIETKMPFTQTTDEDKWIDDPESKDYNRHIRGKTDAKSYENLKLENDYYKFCMVIEYNTNPIIKSKGSAIFFHLGEENPGSTSGCVAINETNMKWILKWMNPELKPSIIMGNKEVLVSGLNE